MRCSLCTVIGTVNEIAQGVNGALHAVEDCRVVFIMICERGKQMPRVRKMPTTAYNRVKAVMRDYDRRLAELEQLKSDIVHIKATNYDGMPKCAGSGSGLEDKIAFMVDLEKEMEKELGKIQKCIDLIPADMRDGIVNNVTKGTYFPLNEQYQLVPSLRTWQREKEKFMLRVARELHIYIKYPK